MPALLVDFVLGIGVVSGWVPAFLAHAGILLTVSAANRVIAAGKHIVELALTVHIHLPDHFSLLFFRSIR